MYTTLRMYVRWQSRKRNKPAFGGRGKQLGRPPPYIYTRPRSLNQDVHWAAIVVENVRVRSKPTQRHVAYLGGITDSAIAILAQRCWFWDHVKQRLDRLANRISVDERQQIESAIAAKVPCPTRPEYNRCVRVRDALLGRR